MNQYLSDKIRIISFLAIILVLYIHSGFHDYPHEISGMPFNNILQDFISDKIGRCAVPLFFAISGFLFFKDTDSGIYAVIEKMRRRVRTLHIPYVIAAVSFPTFLSSQNVCQGLAILSTAAALLIECRICLYSK